MGLTYTGYIHSTQKRGLKQHYRVKVADNPIRVSLRHELPSAVDNFDPLFITKKCDIIIYLYQIPGSQCPRMCPYFMLTLFVYMAQVATFGGN